MMPQQLKFVLQNMRVFGHFEQPIFLEIVKYIEYISVPANQYLFKVRTWGGRLKGAGGGGRQGMILVINLFV
jgi:hypothetical protein